MENFNDFPRAYRTLLFTWPAREKLSTILMYVAIFTTQTN